MSNIWEQLMDSLLSRLFRVKGMITGKPCTNPIGLKTRTSVLWRRWATEFRYCDFVLVRTLTRRKGLSYHCQRLWFGVIPCNSIRRCFGVAVGFTHGMKLQSWVLDLGSIIAEFGREMTSECLWIIIWIEKIAEQIWWRQDTRSRWRLKTNKTHR